MAHTIEEVRTRRSAYRRKYHPQRVETLEQLFSHNRCHLTQTFWIDPLQENTIRGKNGIAFRIPALAFEDQWGDPVLSTIKVEVIELTKKSDILLADRATISGNQLLETGGAFYFGASRNNSPLRLGAPVQASVPISSRVDHPAYMAVFGGQNRGGAFDWRPATGSDASLKIDTINQTFNVSVQQPGWVNCDHYYRLRRQQHYYLQVTPSEEMSEQEVFLIYRTINTVAKLRRNEHGTFTFPSPIPLPAIIYSLGAADGAFHQGFHHFIQDPYRQEQQQEPQRLEVEIPMSHIGQEDIQSNLEEQIRFWDREVTKKVNYRFGWQRRQRFRR